MAGSLGVRLEKPGAYTLGTPARPLTAEVIDDAVWRVWAAGGATIVLAAGFAALLTRNVVGVSAAPPALFRLDAVIRA